eukprot:CAMPEP_0118957740 /NCGR_PEP_ID=MMETSP1169-20130426/62266_1 /TAXON_ID=36882 /ORGANISM="Pyramimonas obovata, Strain CCMP722" /LENGTH=334 /DNA_ID=CAMNT_0006905839 /DNA_START=223 /DNA_END=1227 /DNA_ORIENTATION=-
MNASIELHQGSCTRANGLVQHSLNKCRIFRRFPACRTHVCKASVQPHETPKRVSSGKDQDVKATAPVQQRISGWINNIGLNSGPAAAERVETVFDPFNKPNYDDVDGLPMPSALRSIFRKQVQLQAGATSPTEGYKGLMEEVELLNVKANGSAVTAQELTLDVFKGVMPLWLPLLYKQIIHKIMPAPLENAMFSLVTASFFRWLVGDVRILDAKDAAKIDLELTGAKVGQAVRIERCRFLEESGPCAGTCMNNCKVPTQRWMLEDFGVPVRVTPNYEDYSCTFAYGVEPLDAMEDPGYDVPCFSTCEKRKRSIAGEEGADNIQCGDVTKRPPLL